MSTTWPSFVTKDLPDTEDGYAEMLRRWEVYNREMQVVIASGVAHLDEDSWWVCTATGELIGPDPEIERPWTEEDFASAQRMTFAEACDLVASIRQARAETAQSADVGEPNAADEPPEPPRPLRRE